MVTLDESSLNGMSDALEESVVETQEEETQEVQTESPVETESTSFKLGDREYNSDELSELVGLGSRAKELGESHGGFDKFVSEYGRKSEKIGELNKRLTELETSKQNLAPVAEVEDNLEEARTAARKLGIVLKDDLDSYYQNRRSAEKLIDNCQTLEQSIDGSDGRPKFDTVKVLEFMEKNTGFTDPKRAYEAMNIDSVSSWKAEQLNKNKSVGISTITETESNKSPEPVRANKDNLYALIAEQMNQ